MLTIDVSISYRFFMTPWHV